MAQDKAENLIRGLDGLEMRPKRALPPVETWFPEPARPIDMKIHADGQWSYQASPITRQAMVRLFSTILRRECDQRYFLVTPVEKCEITVADAPFVAVDMTHSGKDEVQQISFITNVGDEVALTAAQPIRFSIDHKDGGLRPYIFLRHGLECLLSRSVVFELMDYAEEYAIAGQNWLGIWSGSVFWPIACADDVKAETNR